MRHARRGGCGSGTPRPWHTDPAVADSFPGIWPEDTYAAAVPVANGPDTEPWRFDSRLLVAQFAGSMLDWENPILGPPSTEPSLPYFASIDVRREPGGPIVTLLVAQVAGEAGWVVTRVSAPIADLGIGYAAPNTIDIGFDRFGAATVEVHVSVRGVKYTATAEHEHPAHYRILFRDSSGNVIAAISDQVAPKIIRRPVG